MKARKKKERETYSHLKVRYKTDSNKTKSFERKTKKNHTQMYNYKVKMKENHTKAFKSRKAKLYRMIHTRVGKLIEYLIQI